MAIQRETYPVLGMTCAVCVRKIETALGKTEGIKEVSVNFASENVTLSYDDQKISLDKITEEYEVVFTKFSHNLEKNFFRQETVKEVLRIVVNMEESYRIPLILRDLQDYSYREIAELTGKPIGTVKTNIHRARKIIKEKLKNYK